MRDLGDTRSIAKTATENQIVSAKNDNRLLLCKTILRQAWDR